MEFRDLKRQYIKLKPRIDEAMLNVIDNTAFISGRQVTELEAVLAEYVGVKHCITCANGTDALTLALMAWGIGSKDAVFVPDFTFFASAEVVAYEGATPFFVEVDDRTFNINTQKLEERIEAVAREGKYRPRVIMAVDLFGQPAQYPEIRRIADKYGMLILEDGAQGFGGRIAKECACSFGDISTTSFFPAKPLGCYGDGGAIFTNSDEWAGYMRSVKIHGMGQEKYDNVRIGINSRLDTLQAAILLIKFEAFKNYELESINRAADEYTRLLEDTVCTPYVIPDYYSSWAQYTIVLKNKEQRDGLQGYLKEKGIPSMVYYPKMLSEQTAFKSMEYSGDISESGLPNRVLSLPIHPYIEFEEIGKICRNIQQYPLL